MGRQPMGFLKEVGKYAREWPASILFPPTCLGCRELVTAPGTLCPECWPEIQFLERPWCPVMGIPFDHEMGEGFLSGEAIADPPPFNRARSAVSYTGAARRMAQALKFSDRTDLAPWMARWMLRAASDLVTEADMIIPVPLHRRRFFFRRFNQSAELARALARLTRLAYDPEALVRRRKTRQQVGLGRSEREKNVSGAFFVPPRKKTVVNGRQIILIDDVYTTGATVRAATHALKRAGARAVDVLTFARVIPEDFASRDRVII